MTEIERLVLERAAAIAEARAAHWRGLAVQSELPDPHLAALSYGAADAALAIREAIAAAK